MKLVDFLVLLLVCLSTAQVERDCVCNAEGVWLDIVVAIDTSTYNSGYISTAKQILINIARQLPVSLGLGQYTRFSLITYNAFNSTANIIGDLHAYDDAEEFVAAVNTVAATSYTADLYTPFLAASSVFNGTHTRPNVKKLFILIPAIYRVTVDIAPLANQLKGNDTTIMIVDFWYQTAATQGSAQYLALASPGLFFNRTTPNLQDRIVEALCQVNCNCLGDWKQFLVGTKKYGECVRYVNISSTWATARVACQNLVPGAYLVHEYSQAKRTFNIGVAQNTPFYNGLNAWHIGLRWNGTRYNWEGAGNVSIPLTEPVQWARGFPNTVYGSNVWNYHDGWENVSEEPAAYLCQSAALCDSENYCSTL